MDVTPHQLRTIELREAWRGYRQDDVDELLDQVAGTIERLQSQVRRLTERLVRVEDEAGVGREADEMLRRTLLLAQRTADAAVSEAQERARRVLSESEVQAHSIVTGAEEEARRVAVAERQRLEGEVRELSRRRDALLADVDALEAASTDHRRRLREFLEAEIGRIDSRPLPTTAPVRAELRAESAPSAESAEAAAGPETAATAGVRADDDGAAEPAALTTADESGVPAGHAEATEHDGREADGDLDGDLEEEPGFDAFADLDGGVADLLPRRRRRKRRPAGDEADDDFFSELRAAVTDETPLGPTDDDVDEPLPAEREPGTDEPEAPASEAVEAAEVFEGRPPGDSELNADTDDDLPRSALDEIVLDEMAGGSERVGTGEAAAFFDQDAPRERGEREFREGGDGSETWNGSDDGIPDGGRLRSVFRRRE